LLKIAISRLGGLGGFDLLSGVLEQHASLHRMSKRLRQRAMNMQHRLRSKTLACLPAFHIAL
jgi:hypothetical protein